MNRYQNIKVLRNENPFVGKIGDRYYKTNFYPEIEPSETDIYIEAKGRFLSSDRTKMLMIQQQHPDIDIRFLFMNCHQKLYKGSKTSYGQWCGKHNFKWANKIVPLDWLKK